MLSEQARAELRRLLGRAGSRDAAGAAHRIEQQCAAHLTSKPLGRATATRAQLRVQMPAELRRFAKLPRGIEPHHRLDHFALWARYHLWREGVRLAVAPRSHMAQALQLLLDHAGGGPRDAAELLRRLQAEPIFPPPGVVRVRVVLPPQGPN